MDVNKEILILLSMIVRSNRQTTPPNKPHTPCQRKVFSILHRRDRNKGSKILCCNLQLSLFLFGIFLEGIVVQKESKGLGRNEPSTLTVVMAELDFDLPINHRKDLFRVWLHMILILLGSNFRFIAAMVQIQIWIKYYIIYYKYIYHESELFGKAPNSPGPMTLAYGFCIIDIREKNANIQAEKMNIQRWFPVKFQHQASP